MDKKVSFDFESAPSRMGTHAEKYDSRGRYFGRDDVTPLWVADMDLPSPDFLADALRERVGHPLFGYTVQYDELFDAVKWWMQTEHDAAVESSWVLFSPSVVTSLCMALQGLTQPGEGVVVLSPVYGPFFFTAEANERRVEDCPLIVNNGLFEIDWETLGTALSKPDVTLLILSNPHNPGGRVWTREELTRLAELCAANGVVIFSDEVHSDIVFLPHRNTSMLTIPAARDRVVVAHSIGKTFNASGLQVSFCIISDPQLRQAFGRAQERAHTGDCNLLGKVAMVAAFSPAGAAYKRCLTATLHENIREVCRRLSAVEGLQVMEPQATYLVWCDFRAFGPWPDVMKRLVHSAGVALSGGTFFGPAGEGWFRINCAHPRAQLLPAIDRIVAEFSYF
jgi:cystathionine beta-lyase